MVNNKVQQYLKHGRYLPLGDLELVGVIVHDEVAELDRALRTTGDFSAVDYPESPRFPARLVWHSGKCVLLVGTGMGGAGSSIVVYELAYQRPKVPVLKVGTCVSTWRSDNEVGTVFLPDWALADDGVVGWDGRCDLDESTSPGQQIVQVLGNKTLVAANGGLRGEWEKHIRNKAEPGSARDRLEGGKTAVLYSDAFYQIWQLPGFSRHLAEGYYVTPGAGGGRTTVANIGQCENVSGTSAKLLGWDMETAALFSAGQATGLAVAAALVVSWSNEHWTDVGIHGDSKRTNDDSRLAHRIEHELLHEGLRFLLNRPPSP